MREQMETRSFGINASEIAAIDGWLEEIGARWGASERAMFGARLCAAELAANSVEHGVASTDVASTDADRMVVTVRQRSNGIELEFLDPRAPFDPTGPARTVKTEGPGGYGLALLQAYATGLTYSHDGTYNRVHLTVRSN